MVLCLHCLRPGILAAFLSHGRKAGFSQLLANQCASDRAQGSSNVHPDKKIFADGWDCDLRFVSSFARVSQGCGRTFSGGSVAAAAKQIRRTAPKGAPQFKELTASLKRCPDTKLEFFRNL